MKKPTLFAALAACLTLPSSLHGFTHPGIPLSKEDLDTLKANLNSEPWKSGYAALQSDSRSSLTYTMQGPRAQVSRSGSYDSNLPAWQNDMTAMYNLSRMWYFTGNQAYAQKARDILIAWATTHVSFTGNESGLALGPENAYRYAGGASILRGTWPGWTAGDTTTVQAYFNNVLWPATMANGNTLGPANKGSFYMAGAISIAAFCDDADKFNKIVEFLRTNNSAGLPNTLATGEMGETGRDQGHAYGDLLARAFVAEVAWKQGVDLFSERNNRLLACGEYYAANNLVSGVPFVHFGTIDYHYYANSGDAGGSYPASRSGLYLVQGAYKIRKGLPTPWLDQKITNQTIDMDNWMFCKSADTSAATPPAAASFPAVTTASTGLTDAAINNSSPAGSSAFANGVWTVVGAGGGGVWTHAADQCQFAYKQITGDCAVVAKVTGVQNTHATAKAGVMIRETLDGTTPRRAWIGITPSNTFESYLHGWSDNWGGSGWEKRSQAGPSTPYWVKIERRGKTITTFTSQDGTSWAAANCGYFDALADTTYIGLFVCSNVTGTANTSTFTNVAITGGNGAPATIPDAPAAVMASSSPGEVTVRWLPSFGATGYDVLRSTTSGSGFTAIASNVAADPTSYTDNSVSNGTTYYYVVRANNSAGTSGNSAQRAASPTSALTPLAFGGSTSADTGTGSGGQLSGQAFDGNVGTKWYNGTSQASGWLQYDFGAGNEQVVKAYQIASANDVPTRDPKDWSLLGSNDGANWTTLDTRAGQTFAFRLQHQTYQTANTTAYRHYRLNITANNGGTSGLQLAELVLLGDSGRTILDGTYRVLNRKSNKSLDVSNGSTANGAPLIQWDYQGGSNQKWTFTHLGGGQYKIIGLASGKSVDVNGASTANGATLLIWPYGGANNQRWTVTPTGDGFHKLTAVHSGKSADINAASTANGASVIQWPFAGSRNQQWSISACP